MPFLVLHIADMCLVLSTSHSRRQRRNLWPFNCARDLRLPAPVCRPRARCCTVLATANLACPGNTWNFYPFFVLLRLWMLLAEAWIWKSQGCLNGALCLRCHLCPAGEIKRRKKDGRQRYMGLLQSCNARQEQLKRLTVGTVGRCEDEETGSTHLQITPLLAATSLPPVPPPTSSPMVDFLDDALPPAPTWDTKDAEPLQPLVPPLAQPLAQPLASVGSALHGTGNCKPCAWFWKPQAGRLQLSFLGLM